MKASLIIKLTKEYSSLFNEDWKLNKKEFVRRSTHWIQFFSLNDSQGGERYIPCTACQFVYLPGPVTGSYLVYELQAKKHLVQRWISLREHKKGLTDIKEEILKQFFPNLQYPIDEHAIETKLLAGLDYWPNSYALCVMSCVRGEIDTAKKFFDIYIKATADKPYPWVIERKAELTKVLDMSRDKHTLSKYLKSIEAQCISQIKVYSKQQVLG